MKRLQTTTNDRVDGRQQNTIFVLTELSLSSVKEDDITFFQGKFLLALALDT